MVLTGILFFFTTNKEYPLKLSFPKIYQIIDYFFIFISSFILISTFSQNIMSEITLPFSIVLSFLLPGWVFLRIFRFDAYKQSVFESLVLSFAFSIGLTSLIFLLHFPLRSPELLSSIFFGLSLIPVIFNKFQKKKSSVQLDFSPNKGHDIHDIVLLGVLLAFVISVTLWLYPAMSDVPGQDITRHSSWVDEILVTPEIYGEEYPWFHYIEAVLVEISDAPIWLLHLGTTFLSAFMIFSFYIMSKAYLVDIDKRAHRLATLFFTVFSGFGWLFFLQQKFSLEGNFDLFNLLDLTRYASYWDVEKAQGLWLLMWFRPVTLGFTLFFILIYLLRNQKLSKGTFLIFSSLLLLTLSQIYFPELVIFVGLIFILSLLHPSLQLRIKETSLSILIALGVSTFITFVSQLMFSPDFQPFSFIYVPVLGAMASVSYILCHFKKRPKLPLRMNSNLAISIGFFFFFILLSYWLVNTQNFVYENLTNIYPVPWEFYPTLLGILAVFAIPSCVYILRKYRDHPLVIFVILLFLVIILGKLITYVNSEIFWTNYWERRMIPMIFVCISLLAPITIFWVFRNTAKIHFLKNHSNYIIIAFFSFLILGGTLSTFLSLEYQILSNQRFSLDDSERKIRQELTTLNSTSTVLTVSQHSRDIVDYAVVGQVLDSKRFELWQLQNPEFPLTAMSSLQSPSIIFLSDFDMRTISDNYDEGYLGTHLIHRVPLKEGSSSDTIFQMPSFNPPTTTGKIFLILPDMKKEFYTAYDILSLGGYEYSPALLDDINTYRNAKILVAPDELTALKLLKNKEPYNLGFEKLIVINLLEPIGLTKVDLGLSPNFIESKISLKEWTKEDRSNSTGNFYFDGFVFDNRQVVSSIQMPGNKTIILPNQVEITETFELDSFQPIALYDGKFPFIAKQIINGIELYYIDIKPLLQGLNDEVYSRKFYPLLSKLLDFPEAKSSLSEILEKEKLQQHSGGYFTYKNSTFLGKTELESDSTIIEKLPSSIEITIDDQNFFFENVSKIIPIDTDLSIVNSNEVTLTGGPSFYSSISTNSSSINFIGNPAIISLYHDDGKSDTLIGNEIKFNLTYAKILQRQPHVISDGLITLKEVYGHGPLKNMFHTIGQDIKFSGRAIFNNTYPDKLTFADGASFVGKITYSEMLNPYNELDALYNIFNFKNLPYVFAIGIILLTVNLTVIYKKRKPHVLY